MTGFGFFSSFCIFGGGGEGGGGGGGGGRGLVCVFVRQLSPGNERPVSITSNPVSQRTGNSSFLAETLHDMIRTTDNIV